MVELGEVKLVLYDELKENPISIIKDLLFWLNVENPEILNPEARFACLQSHLDGHFKRHKGLEQRQREMEIYNSIGIREQIKITIIEVNSLVEKYTGGSMTLRYLE